MFQFKSFNMLRACFTKSIQLHTTQYTRIKLLERDHLQKHLVKENHFPVNHQQYYTDNVLNSVQPICSCIKAFQKHKLYSGIPVCKLNIGWYMI